MIKKICAEAVESNLGTLDLKASTLSIWPLALLKNGTLSALPYDSNSECLKFYKSKTDIVLQSVCYFGTVNILNIQNLNNIVLQSVCFFGTCKILNIQNMSRKAVLKLFNILNIQNLNDIVLQPVCYFGTVNILNIQNLNDIVLQSFCYFGTCKIYTFRIWVIRQCWKCSIFQESQWSNG